MGRKRIIVKRQLRRPPAVKTVEPDPEAADYIDFNKLQENYKIRRKHFVSEYIKDYNATRAILRMGYKYDRKVAQTKGSQFLSEPYTQHILAEIMERMEEKAIVTRSEILIGLKREANAEDVPFSSNSGTRIQALRYLAKILGMEVLKADIEVKTTGGVMLVPLSASPEEWEAAAAASQKKLKHEVRE